MNKSKIDKLHEVFKLYFDKIISSNQAIDSGDAIRLESVIALILNKCNGWKLKRFSNPRMTALDLYDYEQNIGVQVKSRPTTYAEIKADKQKIKDNTGRVEEFKSIQKHYYFIPVAGELLKEECINNLKIKIIDKKELLIIIETKDKIDFVLDLFNVFKVIEKTNGCYLFSDIKNDNNIFNFLSGALKVIVFTSIIDTYIRELTISNELFIQADAGRGKTSIGYLSGQYFLEKKWNVIYFDLNEFNEGKTFFSRLNKVIFPQTFLIVDNCQSGEHLIPLFKEFSKGKDYFKIVYLSRSFRSNKYIPYRPDNTTIDLITSKNNIKIGSRLVKNINKIVGENNSNLRLLSVLLSAKELSITKNRFDLFEEIYSMYVNAIPGRSESERCLRKLDALALGSLDKIEYIDTTGEDEGIFDTYYNQGLLVKIKDRLAFPHSQDAIAFLAGKYKYRFVNEVIEYLFKKCIDCPGDAKMLDMFNSTMYNYIDIKNIESAELKSNLRNFITEWKIWVELYLKESNIMFSTNLHTLHSYYLYSKIFAIVNSDYIILHFKKFIKNNRDCYTKNPFMIELLIVISTRIAGDRYKLVDLLLISDKELLEIYYSVKVLPKIRKYIRKKIEIPKNQHDNEDASISSIINYFIDDKSTYTEINAKNIDSIWIDSNKDYEFNDVPVRKVANKLKLLIDSSYLNEHIFIKAIEYFLKNIEQVKLNSPSLAIASFICQIRRINFDWYENVINFDRVKLYIEKYLSGNWDFKSITFLDKIFHPDIDYIYSIYNSGIEHVSEDVLEKFMFDKKKNMDEKKYNGRDTDLYTYISYRP